MSLTLPGATNHMTSSSGTLSRYVNTSSHNSIIIGSVSDQIPILCHGHSSIPPLHPPLTLKNVLHAPRLIKNLVSVRRLTIDNNVTVEFDPFGFYVKDLFTGRSNMR